MNIFKEFRSRIIVIDRSWLYLGSIGATYQHLRLLRKNQQLYHHRFGRMLDWRNPTRYTEKIHLFMISDRAEKVTAFADKYEVREYVRKTIGEEYLVPLIGVYSSVDEIDIDRLPSAFVLKCTHGSNWNVICPDQSQIGWQRESEKLRVWMHSNFYSKYFAERQYRTMKHRIVCEEYLDAPDGLIDYKFHCFHGRPQFIRVMTNRQHGIKKATYDMDWKKAPFTFLSDKNGSSSPEAEVSKPKGFEQMIEIASKLSTPFPYVRVDLYNINGKIYFSELTFSPNAGLDIFSPDSYDQVYGALME